MSKSARDNLICIVIAFLLLSFIGWLFGSAFKKAQQRAKEIASRTIKESGKRAGDMNLTVFDLDGHTYVLASGTYKASMLHAEHCPCKRNGLYVHGYITNHPIALRYQTNVVDELAPEILNEIVNKLKEKK